MNRKLNSFLFLIFLLSSCALQAQSFYKKGFYVVKGEGQKSAFIKNKGLNHFSNEILVKENLSDTAQKIPWEQLQSFGIDGEWKMVKKSVQVDRSTDLINSYSKNPEPEYKTELVMLRVLIEGKISLYEFVDGNTSRYYYSLEDEQIVPLVYKKYQNTTGSISENNSYIDQLKNVLTCLSNKNDAPFKKLTYKVDPLVDILLDYYECSGESYISWYLKKSEAVFSFGLKTGFSANSFRVETQRAGLGNQKFNTQIAPVFAFDFEFYFPKERGGWSIFIEPSFQQYQSEIVVVEPDANGISRLFAADLKTIQIPVGYRKYFSFNNKSSLFVNGGFAFNLPISSSLEYRTSDGIRQEQFIVRSRGNVHAGVGFLMKRKISLEYRFNAPQDVLESLTGTNSNLTGHSILIGFKIR